MEGSKYSVRRLGKIKTPWIREALSELLSTFILGLFVFGSGAQLVLSEGVSSSPWARSLAIGSGVMIAMYCGIKASGASMNPNVTLMFCLAGRLQWNRMLIHTVTHIIASFLAAALTYAVYHDMILGFDDSESAQGVEPTALIFITMPLPTISLLAAFFDVFVGTGILSIALCVISDPNNCKVPIFVAPLACCMVLYGIGMTFGIQTGGAINPGLDLGGRLWALCVGYGPEVFSARNYWFWIPLLAGPCGTIVFVTVYHVMVANHLPSEDQHDLDLHRDIELECDLDPCTDVDIKPNGSTYGSFSVMKNKNTEEYSSV